MKKATREKKKNQMIVSADESRKNHQRWTLVSVAPFPTRVCKWLPFPPVPLDSDVLYSLVYIIDNKMLVLFFSAVGGWRNEWKIMLAQIKQQQQTKSFYGQTTSTHGRQQMDDDRFGRLGGLFNHRDAWLMRPRSLWPSLNNSRREADTHRGESRATRRRRSARPKSAQTRWAVMCWHFSRG